ncbi:putative uncharacterized protein [Acidaminococcus sp. CAG:917]|nr:putative uncharacterized protein [Acidaminococcus sp. CAG:917]
MRLPYLSASSAQSIIAVICGTPIPATILVVHIEPGPMPTLTISAPASISAFVASAVATLPAMTGSDGYFFLICFTTLSTFSLCP